MGCDIHMQVEVRRGGEWHREPYRELPCNYSYCEDGVYSQEVPNQKMRGEKCPGCDGTGHKTRVFWDSRNYDVFGILADVRNGSGFAGIDTGDGFVPIDSPRGLPSDLSPEIRGMLDLHGDDDSHAYRASVEELLGPGWTSTTSKDGKYTWWNHPQGFWLGDHSHSHVSVAELLAYDWTRTTKKRGWVDPWNFDLWRRDGRPQGWSGGVSGQDIEHVSNQTLARLIDSGDLVWEGEEPPPGSWNSRPYSTSLQRSMREWNLPEGSVGATMTKSRPCHYTLVEWEIAYSESAQEFLDELHAHVVPLGAPEDVRLVMGFDS